MSKKIRKIWTFTPELAEKICHAISTTPKMLEEICKDRDDLPSASTIYAWRIKYPSFGEMYSQAKAAQIEVLVNQMFVLLRDRTNDYVFDADGKPCINHAHIHKLKIEVDAIKWLAAKLAPKLYGDRAPGKSNDSEDAISKFRVDE